MSETAAHEKQREKDRLRRHYQEWEQRYSPVQTVKTMKNDHRIYSQRGPLLRAEVIRELLAEMYGDYSLLFQHDNSSTHSNSQDLINSFMGDKAPMFVNPSQV